MALPEDAWCLRVGYIEELKKRGVIELISFPGAPGVWIITKSMWAVGIASRPRGKRRLWTRQDRRLRIGGLLVSRWVLLTNPKSIKIFEELARKTGIPNVWIEVENGKLLFCLTCVEDLLCFHRMQYHIIDENGKGYLLEYAHLSAGLTELENLCLTWLSAPQDSQKTNKTIAVTLAYIEALFERCLNQHKIAVVQQAAQLRERINHIYQLSQFDDNLRQMIESLKRREQTITIISPFIASRKKAAQEIINLYQRRLASSLKFVQTQIEQFEVPRTPQQIEGLQSALRKRAEDLKADILCQPCRTPARQAAARLISTANDWLENPTRVLADLKFSRGWLLKAQSYLT
ncbi:MAG: hypothetical protein CEN89_518 [Candidatus Berkelbacteria bacterium Licking1014_7]|uniref:Uncharacterized protein n=1 Tax=Candidatus Berkelbacteria bacterium Licking1014_7 TaxID=2017147 RepID=A0A554LIP6_9BACT|nr:MAG: hypothetical protein CEN89_518 [Candidatus Berkelbacteria bacterium Licking1014_7]